MNIFYSHLRFTCFATPLLKQFYFDDNLDSTIKQNIINTISFFPTCNDYDFYHKAIISVFLNKDEEVCKDILKSCYESLKFIEYDSFQIKIIKNNNSKQKLIYGNRCIFNCNYIYTTTLKAIKYFKKKNIDFKVSNSFYSKYFIETIDDNHSEAILDYKLLDNRQVEISLTIKNIVVLNISELDMYQFLQDFKTFTNNYFDKEQAFNLYINKDERNNIIFKTTWNKKYDRYLTNIIFDQKVTCRVDTRDLIFIFSSLLSHLTLIYELKYSICLQKESHILKKDYIKLISLFERAI